MGIMKRRLADIEEKNQEAVVLLVRHAALDDQACPHGELLDNEDPEAVGAAMEEARAKPWAGMTSQEAAEFVQEYYESHGFGCATCDKNYSD